MATTQMSTRVSGFNKYLLMLEMHGNRYMKVTLWILLNMLINSPAVVWSITLTWEHQTWRRISYPACIHWGMTVLLLSHGPWIRCLHSPYHQLII